MKELGITYLIVGLVERKYILITMIVIYSLIFLATFLSFGTYKFMPLHYMRKLAGARYVEISDVMDGVSSTAIAKSIHRFNRNIKNDAILREKSEMLSQNILSLVRT